MNDCGATVWFTGLSGAGKSTLVGALEKELRARGKKVEILDGDIVRQNLTKGLGFSKEDRDENILRIGFVANLLSRNGVVVLVAVISPYRETRDKVRGHVEANTGKGSFLEVFVNCPLDVCEKRDPKGLYKKARNNEIKNFTGVSDPYEPPENPEVVVLTAEEDLTESAGKVLKAMQEKGLLK